jgi:ATP-dependent DNA helicase RecQ
MPKDAADLIAHTAREAFGYEALRAGQTDAVAALLDGRDVLAVMPTGFGKSAIYQLAALLREGPTVVVSPLIALQRDQIEGLAELGTAGAVAANSAQSSRETEAAWEAVRRGAVEFIFLAPEQLAKTSVLSRLAAVAPSLFAVDEAHLVASWGHDFRPDYLLLGDVIDALGRPPVVALTATASPLVRTEIVERLRLRDPVVVSHGFDRPNISLSVLGPFGSDQEKREAALMRAAAEPKPGIVYTGTRRAAESFAAGLRDLGFNAEAYHAGLKRADRDAVQEAFMVGNVDVMCATTAFGMGIDKPDVRFVLHTDIPGSVDAYYQEVGRAGRDGEPAEALLFYRPEDLARQRWFASGAPDRDELMQLCAELVRRDHVSTRELAAATRLPQRRVTTLTNLLADVGALSRRRGLVSLRGDAAADTIESALERDERRRRADSTRLEMMRGYAETTGCRRQYLLAYFGETLARVCGNCDTCAEGTATSEQATESAYDVGARVSHAQFGGGTVMSVESDRLTVLFDEFGYRTLATEVIESERLFASEGWPLAVVAWRSGCSSESTSSWARSRTLTLRSCEVRTSHDHATSARRP